MQEGNLSSKYYHRYLSSKVEDNAIYLYDKDSDEWQYLCRYLDVKEIRTNIITGDVEVELEYIHNDEIKTMTVSRDVFVKNKILNILPAKGIDVTDRNAMRVIDYLLYREQFANFVNIHEQVGWEEIDDKRVFLLDKVVGGYSQAMYCGELNIKPLGTYNKWKEVIEKEVIGNSALELALVLGLSSPIASLLKRLLGLDVLFFHIYGNSTTGKTTALTLATSAFGFPSKNNKGLIKTWLATDNAILGYLKGIHGLPMAIDEASVRVNKDYSKMIYQIVDGVEKARMNKNGDNRERGEWSGTVLSTAENSLLSNSNQNNGLRVRLLELGQIQWTKSAENAENLKSQLLENYGHAGMKFIKYLMMFSDEEIIEGFKKSKEEVKYKIKTTDNFTDRIADKIAAVYLTSLIAKEALELDLNSEKILEILINQEAKQIEDRDIGLKAYEYLKEAVIINFNKFISKDNLATYNPNEKEYSEKELPRGDILGRLETSGDKIIEVLIPKQQLKKLLEEGGFTDIDIILSNWRSRNIIDTDGGKFTRKRTICKGMSSRVIVIKMNNFIEEEQKDLEKDTHKVKHVKKILRNSNIEKVINETYEEN